MPSTCTVTGTLKDVSNTALSGVTVRAYITQPFFHSDDTFITDYDVSTTTNASGVFTLTLIETATVSKTMILAIEFPTGAVEKLRREYTITVPNAASANISTLITP